MKPNLLPNFVFRAPKFSWIYSLKECWNALKSDISISSPSFYSLIKDISEDEVDGLSPKIKFTLWKYFNRSRFRATPFGTFSGFGLLRINQNATNEFVKVKFPFKAHSFVNWPCKNEVEINFHEVLGSDPLLFCNSTYYTTQHSIRFIYTNEKLFEIAEVGINQRALNILNATQKPILKSELYNRLNVDAESLAEMDSLLVDMMELQLIFSDKTINIIGEDYFQRMGLTHLGDNTPYVISEIEVENNEVNFPLFKYIPQLIDVLQRNVPMQNMPALEAFKSKFLEKFDQNEVPLMMALDPEMGIGYDELEQSNLNSDFINKLVAKKNSNASQRKDNLKQKLSAHTQFNKSSNKAILLDDLIDNDAKEFAPIPNSLSIVVQQYGDKLLIENLGGSTVNTLYGRFTLANNELLNLSKEIASAEELANPGILFFDVAYMGEANVDNINRRASIYNHQLSILNYDLSENPLTLNDILISVKDNEVVLKSISLNKRLIPRLASAYNYSRSDLSVFRLLCDLQYQGIHASLLPDPEKLFPDKNYYPRLEYKNLIISLAKWRIKKIDLIHIKEDAIKFFNDNGIPYQFRCGLGDQLLCFNIENDGDKEAFINYIAKQEELLLEEFLLPNKPLLIDDKNNPLIGQYVLTAYHNQPIYNDFKNRYSVIFGQDKVVEQFIPGSEWVYFEIFCHHQRANSILLNPIHELLISKCELIESWFFIRYSVNGNHLRFRVKLKLISFYNQIISSMYSLIMPYVENGLVSDLQIKTYKRELSRYGADLIEEVEKHFEIDSDFVLNHLIQLDDDFLKYKLIINSAKEIIKRTLFNGSSETEINSYKHFSDKSIQYIKKYSDAFIEEHHLDSLDFKQLNIQYQKYRNYDEEELNYFKSEGFINSFVKILNKSLSCGRNIFGDLFHMHVNRSFSELQRTHELIIYYFLYKDLQKEKATSKN